MSNPHYLFHVAYYAGLGTVAGGGSPYPALNEALVRQRYAPSCVAVALAGESFEMETRYPGLLMGLGYPHEVGKEADTNAEDAIKMGFFLDYATGLPVIPGSTVKGMLRSAFRLSWEYIRETAAELGIIGLDGEADVCALETAIFGEWCKDAQRDRNSAPGISQRDVFFDAVPVQPDPDGYLLNLESITPHRKEEHGKYAGMKNPVSLKLLKVRPRVRFLFRFRLRDSVLGEKGAVVKADKKKELFRRILADLGAGAKTNVGFGVMAPAEAAKDARYFELMPVSDPARTTAGDAARRCVNA